MQAAGGRCALRALPNRGSTVKIAARPRVNKPKWALGVCGSVNAVFGNHGVA
jgi:hypothetical protein